VPVGLEVGVLVEVVIVGNIVVTGTTEFATNTMAVDKLVAAALEGITAVVIGVAVVLRFQTGADPNWDNFQVILLNAPEKDPDLVLVDIFESPRPLNTEV